MPSKKQLKRIGIDILGGLLIIASALTGWLPGPGGIPLLIIGLSLLATNHEWAARWLQKVKDSGDKISERIFNGSRPMRWIIDIVTILLITAGVLLLMHYTKSIVRSAAISTILLAIVLFLANRHRFRRLKKRINKT
jgi:hypothetical protein